MNKFGKSNHKGLITIILVIIVTITITDAETAKWPTPTCSKLIYTYCHVSEVLQRNDNEIKFEMGMRASSSYTALNIDKSVMEFIPKNLLSIFNNIMQLYIQFSGLTTITPGIFKNSSKITFMNLQYNHVSELDELTFEGADNLETLSLSYNKIERFNKLAISNLKNLQELYLYHNHIENFDPQTFVNNVKLRVLQLGNNKLKAIDFVAQMPVGSLESVVFRENRINDINLEFFSRFQKLTKIDFEDNCLTSLDLTKMQLKTIRHLWIEENYLSEISLKGLKDNFPDITTICFELNNFNCSHITDIINVLDHSVDVVVEETMDNPNVNGMKCWNTTLDDKEIHKMDKKCRAQNYKPVDWEWVDDTEVEDSIEDVEEVVQSAHIRESSAGHSILIVFLILSCILNVGLAFLIFRNRKDLYYLLRFENGTSSSM